MIYACVYPEKFDGDKASKLMQVATEFLSPYTHDFLKLQAM